MKMMARVRSSGPQNQKYKGLLLSPLNSLEKEKSCLRVGPLYSVKLHLQSGVIKHNYVCPFK